MVPHIEPVNHGDGLPRFSGHLAKSRVGARGKFRVTGRKEGWKQFPDGDFIDSTFPPDTETIKKVTELATKRGIGVSKWRVSQGRDGLASPN